jgi:hypothetical protein
MACPVCGEEVCQGAPICGLTYIANSPSQEFGGFHPNAVHTARQAVELILHYEQALTLLGNALNPDDPPFIESMRRLAWDALDWKKANFPQPGTFLNTPH